MTDDDIFKARSSEAHPHERSPRTRLWAELEQLHTALGLPAPTETLTIEDLQARVEELRRQRDAHGKQE